MRLHLDTSFLIDWYRDDPQILSLREEIANSLHQISVDVVVEAEFFAAARVTRDREFLWTTIVEIGESINVTSQAARLAASWLAPMDLPQRRAHFADALIGAVSTTAGAILVTGDRRLAGILPIDVLGYAS